MNHPQAVYFKVARICQEHYIGNALPSVKGVHMCDGKIQQVNLSLYETVTLRFYFIIVGVFFIELMGCNEGLLFDRWKPEGEAEVLSGQFLIFPFHSSVVMVSGMVLRPVHFFMCLIGVHSTVVVSV